MRKQCAWFGCSAAATATYTFDSATCTVWLDAPLDGGARAGDLCDRHARSLKPPREWSVVDRRSTPVPTPAPPEPVDQHDSDPEAELRSVLDAHSPLLARAFRSSGAF